MIDQKDNYLGRSRRNGINDFLNDTCQYGKMDERIRGRE
jgi:hypothetical protein